MERIIILTKKHRKRVCGLFGVSNNYLSEILRFKKNSHKAYTIRDYCVRCLEAKTMEVKV